MKVRLFLVKNRKHIICFVILIILTSLYILNEKSLLSLPTIDNTSPLVGVIGTIIGAIVGGVFTLLGSFLVNSKQVKAQNRKRQKDIIYKPLYDELIRIHNVELINNPYPQVVFFRDNDPSFYYSVNYSAWDRVKADSRYLEVDKHLKIQMEKFFASAVEYNKEYKKLLDQIREVFIQDDYSDIIKYYHGLELEVTSRLLKNQKIDGSIIDLKRSIEGEKVDISYYAEYFTERCKSLNQISIVKNKKIEWYMEEKKTIDMLTDLIVLINLRYEG